MNLHAALTQHDVVVRISAGKVGPADASLEWISIREAISLIVLVEFEDAVCIVDETLQHSVTDALKVLSASGGVGELLALLFGSDGVVAAVVGRLSRIHSRRSNSLSRVLKLSQ
ncbi:hypothetical protein GS489_05415 [Rhodococcus hoagii]|nr:hypothetical protein [Prescottella equi]MBM4569931.1 hypothetical protein [Prescottella equi]